MNQKQARKLEHELVKAIVEIVCSLGLAAVAVPQDHARNGEGSRCGLRSRGGQAQREFILGGRQRLTSMTYPPTRFTLKPSFSSSATMRSRWSP
jgi:hypothetical protein